MGIIYGLHTLEDSFIESHFCVMARNDGRHLFAQSVYCIIRARTEEVGQQRMGIGEQTSAML